MAASGGEGPDPWETLGVPHGASPQEVRAAWRRAARRAHPDVGGDPAVFVRVQTAARFLLEGDPAEVASPKTTAQGDPRVGAPPSKGAQRPVGWLDAEPVWVVAPEAKVLAVTGTSVYVADSDGSVLESRRRVDATLVWAAGFASPVLAAAAGDGVLSVLNADGTAHTVDASSGRTLEVFAVPHPVTAVAAGAVDGAQVLVATNGNEVVCIGGGRRPRWSVRVDGEVSDLVTLDTTTSTDGHVVLVRTTRHVVVAIDLATGRIRWWLRRRLAGSVVATCGPATRTGAQIVWFAGTGDSGGVVHGVDLATGAAVRTVEVGAGLVGLEVVGRLVLVRCANDALVALGANGAPRWKVHTPAAPGGAVVYGENLAVPLADNSLRLLSVDDGGETHRANVEFATLRGTLRTSHVEGDALTVIHGDGGGAVGVRISRPAEERAPR